MTKQLKPIYDLTRKGRPFVWRKEQQDSFEEIKCRLIKPPVLHMQNTAGRFHLYSDISKFCYWKCTIPNTEWQTQADCVCQQKITRSCKKLFHYRIRTVWISYKYS